MRIALVNPTWSFENSTDCGCRSLRLPLEFGACKVLLERAGHDVLMPDGALDGLSLEGLADRVADFAPAMTVVTTASTSLFRRCAQPESRVPRAFLDALAGRGGRTVAVGPHGSVTPATTLGKLGFDRAPEGPGAEVEVSRGRPYSCTFCAEIDFRDKYRRRALPAILEEVDRLIAQGLSDLSFIDEIFLPRRALPEALAARAVEFGVRTRIDLWKPGMLDMLGAAGCVSIEAGVEGRTEGGRAMRDKTCRASTDDLALRLVHARRSVPFVQANPIKVAGDDPETVAARRDRRRAAGIRANDPVPLSPSSPDYRRLWGEPDGEAWERARAHDLGQFDRFGDGQEERPAPLRELEAACCPA
ncbi:B12-binding domain-containing radical SAM protein [Methylobacterium sp. SyP6R]|uniref:B12-binding domain-containing radical SAM protein n=1 Tax=Methylobacterium sp. SyP6R TaxID=2718876 RepID=UPI001F410B96|nr:B12-binding domain-containing radical SAM protein [Methylobacterium sp. SyP6R]MCF4124145.1 B12-binding domain-containing radical SAM protein [Methylobacterium sp. SyP6R]